MLNFLYRSLESSTLHSISVSTNWSRSASFMVMAAAVFGDAENGAENWLTSIALWGVGSGDMKGGKARVASGLLDA